MSRFSMTEDLRDCADELPRTKSWLRAFVASQRFRGAARARSGERDQLAIYDALIVKYAPDLAAPHRQPVHRDFSTLTLKYRTERRS